MYKVGDRVRLISADNIDTHKGMRNGDIYTITSAYEEHDHVCVNFRDDLKDVLYKKQIEKVEESKEMTFPEMVQKLIDGEFEAGTELIMTDPVNYKVTFYVVKNIYGYGLSTRKDDIEDTDLSYPSYINGAWTVKEQPIKEMSIEELQKELGYKIKIVE
ncbi:hypothetical protein [Carnobacterium jeotgali]|uniref:hypothetical protein n=1 Tax=Carnobacterium jeotgali TaxID=545534 RepID=UPI00388F5E97